MAKLPRYLFPSDYMADPSANVFNGRLYIYPSHDWEAGAAFDDEGLSCAFVGRCREW